MKKSQKPHLDFQSNLIGIAETLGDSLVNEIDSSEDELKKLLIKELTVLKRWQLQGGHSLKEISDKWTALRKQITAVRSAAAENSMKSYVSGITDVPN
jgi:hypothetical protein